MIKNILLAVLAIATVAYCCPGSPAPIHAKCQMTVTFPSSPCDIIILEIQDRANKTSGWVDPHNNGTYTVLQQADNYLKLSRLTGDGKYTDLMTFNMTVSGRGCSVDACSESQVFSIKDYNTNYCNLHDLYCGTAVGCKIVQADLPFVEKYVSCSQNDASACLVI